MTEWVEQRIYIKFCIKLEHSSTETNQMIQKATAIQLVIGRFITTMHHSRIISCAEFLAKHQTTQVAQPRFCTLWLLAFPKTKITFEREEISDHRWDSGKYNGVADGDWENCVKSQHAYFEGDWGVIVLCTIFCIWYFFQHYLFHITWLDTSGQTACMAFWAKDEVRRLGFRREEGHSKDSKTSRCSVIRSLLCPIDRSWKVSSGDTAYGQDP